MASSRITSRHSSCGECEQEKRWRLRRWLYMRSAASAWEEHYSKTFGDMGFATSGAWCTCPVLCFPEDPCPSWSALLDYVVCLAQSTRTCFLHFPLSLSGRSAVTVDFSDTSSDEQEEHNAWNPMLELVCHAHIGMHLEVLVGEKELGRIALSCHFALDILCDKSGVRCAQWHAPLPWKKVSIGPHPTPRPARLTAGSRSFPHSAWSDATQNRGLFSLWVRVVLLVCFLQIEGICCSTGPILVGPPC